MGVSFFFWLSRKEKYNRTKKSEELMADYQEIKYAPKSRFLSGLMSYCVCIKVKMTEFFGEAFPIQF